MDAYKALLPTAKGLRPSSCLEVRALETWLNTFSIGRVDGAASMLIQQLQIEKRLSVLRNTDFVGLHYLNWHYKYLTVNYP